MLLFLILVTEFRNSFACIVYLYVFQKKIILYNSFEPCHCKVESSTDCFLIFKVSRMRAFPGICLASFNSVPTEDAIPVYGIELIFYRFRIMDQLLSWIHRNSIINTLE